MSARKNKQRIFAATKEVKVAPRWFKAAFGL